MIDTRELRIGNYVIRKSTGNIQPVLEVLSTYVLLANLPPLFVGKTMTVKNTAIDPIPLDEKLLEKLDFERNGKVWQHFIFPSFILAYPSPNWGVFYGSADANGYINDAGYLHELQNLFYSMYKTELTLEIC